MILIDKLEKNPYLNIAEFDGYMKCNQYNYKHDPHAYCPYSYEYRDFYNAWMNGWHKYVHEILEETK